MSTFMQIGLEFARFLCKAIEIFASQALGPPPGL